jgi:hypothetical protein
MWPHFLFRFNLSAELAFVARPIGTRGQADSYLFMSWDPNDSLTLAGRIIHHDWSDSGPYYREGFKNRNSAVFKELLGEMSDAEARWKVKYRKVPFPVHI